MSAHDDEITALEALLAAKKALGPLRERLLEAKASYQADPGDPDTKTAYEEAARALSDARAESRTSDVLVAPSTPGSMTVSPTTIGKAGNQ